MNRPLISVIALAVSLLAHVTAHAQVAPVVQGPEAVADWFNAGKSFIDQGKALPDNNRRAKNVILFVGDGMGISTITAARILEGHLKGKTGEENRLSFDRFPHTALSKTYSWDQQTSDSAPTMTAMATGYKAREGQLSVNHTTPRGECSAAVIDAKKLRTVLEQAADMGKSTGVVTTARITHATPAALYAHTAMRDWEADSNLPVTDVNTGAPCRGADNAVKDIARQMIEVSPTVQKSLKVALGGGRTYFMPNTVIDPEYAKKLGVDIDALLVSQPDTGEQALEIADMLVRSGSIDLVVIDSVAALVPRAEIEGEMGDTHVGLQARLMSQALRKLTGGLNSTNTTMIFINQLREKIGVFFGSPETTAGGKALKFYASVRLDIRRIETLKDGTDAVGNRTRVKVVKNKMAPPFKQAEFDILYGTGISREGSLIDFGVDHGIVKKSGAWYTYEADQLGQGKENSRNFLIQNPAVALEIEQKILTKLGVGAAAAEAAAIEAAATAVEVEPDFEAVEEVRKEA